MLLRPYMLRGGRGSLHGGDGELLGRLSTMKRAPWSPHARKGLVLAIAAAGLIGTSYLVAVGDLARDTLIIYGPSMSHGPVRQAGVLDDGDRLKVSGARADDYTTYLEGRQTGTGLAGALGDVVGFWPYGIMRLPNGETRILDSATNPPAEVLKNPTGAIHRLIGYVEFNATSGLFDVPELGLSSVANFTFPKLGTWNPETGRYREDDQRIFLVGISESGTRLYFLGKHAGFITKGDSNLGIDQEPDFRTLDETGAFLPSTSEIVKPEWIDGVGEAVIDRETIDAVTGASLAILGVAEAVVAALFFLTRSAVEGRRP